FCAPRPQGEEGLYRSIIFWAVGNLVHRLISESRLDSIEYVVIIQDGLVWLQDQGQRRKSKV
ncbi:hypothetical protein, partial [Alkalibacillus haloalkaliphilus]|uniref:hypothetical protein n=1 Tax=Alkalibacillus haloalkaliphilus TaxID=94136 RepID=UPI0029364DD9